VRENWSQTLNLKAPACQQRISAIAAFFKLNVLFSRFLFSLAELTRFAVPQRDMAANRYQQAIKKTLIIKNANQIIIHIAN
jgi:hypothetical protein